MVGDSGSCNCWYSCTFIELRTLQHMTLALNVMVHTHTHAHTHTHTHTPRASDIQYYCQFTSGVHSDCWWRSHLSLPSRGQSNTRPAHLAEEWSQGCSRSREGTLSESQHTTTHNKYTGRRCRYLPVSGCRGQPACHHHCAVQLPECLLWVLLPGKKGGCEEMILCNTITHWC